MRGMLRVASGLSGKGSTALFLMGQTLAGGTMHGRVCMPVVIPTSYTCDGYASFRQQYPDAKVEVIDPKTFETPEEYGAALTACFEKYDIDVYGQYGVIVKTPVGHLPKKLIRINQHPTRRYFGGDGFYGLVPHAATLMYLDYLSLEYGYSECICHETLEEYDTGAVIMRQRILLETQMTPQQAQKRALFHEWQCQASALLRLYEEGWPLEEYPELLEPLDLEYADLAKQEALELYGKH